ncbi:MAG: hypothetical protein M3Y07_11345 [Acidobacteriota bacterium]|nr:hypothetical protein [Acidobacteriota bacterium]
MTERIYKLQPNRTLALRGFDQLGASAALHAATANSFNVSGIFRDAADFAVLILWDADDFYEHPSIKYLPDFNFAGTTLTFDAAYGTGLQPLDSPQYNWIDWATLDAIGADGTTAQVRLWNFATLQEGNFTAAEGVFDFETGTGLQFYDRVSLWFQDIPAYDFIVVPSISSVEYQFFATGAGATHFITVNGRSYTHTESNPAGESSGDQAAALVAAINAGPGDPQVTAAIGSVPYAVKVSVKSEAAGQDVTIAGSEGNIGATLGLTTLASVIDNIRDQINATDWVTANTTHSLIAASSPTSLTVKAGRYGKVSTSGTAVSWISGTPFVGLTGGLAFRVNGTEYIIASVDGPKAITLTTSAGIQTDVPYLAERGGVDGNMIQMYSLNKTGTLKCTQASVQFSGGVSDVTWRCSVDFSARGIDQLRQCWLTFAPPLANGKAFVDTEWQAQFTNWTLTGGTDATRALQVAGPGSVRIEETDSACKYSGNSWQSEEGFFSNSFAKVASAIGDSVTVRYSCGFVHDLYLGTSLYTDRGVAAIRVDGDSETDLNCYLKNDPAVNTRRKLRSSAAAGSHTVVIRLKAGAHLYFDFLEAAVPSDVPEPPPPRTNISPALDYSTDHTYKLSPARLMWNFDRLGFHGPMNEYIGIFWWNQRKRIGSPFPGLTVTFDGTWADRDTISLNIIGSGPIVKRVFPADTTSTIASHFAYYINAGFVGLWAETTANVLTMTVRSPAYSFVVAPPVKSSASGTVTISGSLQNGDLGTWVVDPSQSPALNRGAREWHGDLYSECQARGREIVTAESMELVNPPDGFAANFQDGTPVTTDEGFGSLHSTHCAQSPPMLAYQQAVLTNIADLQAAAGLVPSLQCGEFLWWFFPYTDKTGITSMAFYDASTKAAAEIGLGRPLHIFANPDDDPNVNGAADATFLRNRLRDHVDDLISHVRAAHPNARFEMLFAYDVNHPTPVGPDRARGGRLNRFINFPVEWESKTSAGFDVLKMEALAFGSTFRDLDLARTAIRFPIDLGWPLDSIRYLIPVFGPATPWEKEWAIATGEGIPITNLWAFDQVSIFGLRVREMGLPGRSAYFGR